MTSVNYFRYESASRCQVSIQVLFTLINFTRFNKNTISATTVQYFHTYFQTLVSKHFRMFILEANL
jgi:hypothetical protein